MREVTGQRNRPRRSVASGSQLLAHPSDLARIDSHLRILEGMCRAFASASSHEEARVATARWMRQAAGSDARVRILVPSEAGQLLPVFSDHPSSTEWIGADSGPMEVLRTKAAVTKAGLAPGTSIAFLPMISRGEAMGVVEVLVSRDSVEEVMPSLEAVASQAAIVFRNLRNQEQAGPDMGHLPMALARDLIAANSPEAAARALVHFLWEQRGTLAVAWVADDDEMLMRPVTVKRVGNGRLQRITERIGPVARWDLLSASERARVGERVAALSGIDGYYVIDAGLVLVLVLGDDQSSVAVSFIGDLLRDAIDHQTTVESAARRLRQLDVALAWTAHEVRGPLAGVKALLEQELESADPLARSTMERVHAEVLRMLEVVEPVLDSAVGSVHLQRQPTDLVDLASESVDGLEGESERNRVNISGPNRMKAWVEPRLFRIVLTNLIKNALAYSLPASEIVVTVRGIRGKAQVSVANSGPEIPVSERESIFDPFIRGRASRARRSGRGIGLFIVRRIVDAHEGLVAVECAEGRTVFRVTIPTEDASMLRPIEPESGLLDGRPKPRQ
jgi:signal transduction histidine kinase